MVRFTPELPQLPRYLVSGVRAQLAAEFWEWFEDNEDTPILEVAVLRFFKRTVILSDLEFVFEFVFGERV